MKTIKIIITILAIAIPSGLIGSAIGITVFAKQLPEGAQWAIQNPKQVRWAMDRQALMAKAADALYFDDADKGITIVKPESK